MIIVLFMCILSGIFLMNLLKEENKLSKIILFSLLIGIVYHTIIFLVLSFVDIYYNKYLFIGFSLLTLFSLVYRKIKIVNDIKKIPLYYLVFLTFICARLLIMAGTGFFEFYNYDEFTAYQTGSTITYLTHNFTEIYQTYAPINYFLGVMTSEFVGLSITDVRIIGPIFFGIMSLFIYFSLRENKVNRHISALLAMMFLICSSEILQIAKSFYTNLFFMVYFTIGIYGIIKHYILHKRNGIPYVYMIMIIGALLTRREAMYFLVIILLILSIYLIIKRTIKLKEFIIMNTPLIFPIVWKFMETKYAFAYGFSNPENENSLIKRVFERLDIDNLKEYIHSIYTQTLSQDYYHFNLFIYILFFITISIIVFKLFFEKNNKYLKFAVAILLVEILYIGMVVATQFVVFSMGEYLQAASFSRYVSSVICINFIVIGCLLYNNTEKMIIKENRIIKKFKRIEKPRVLLIIPAYNEEKSIVNTVNTIIDYNYKSKIKYDYLVINDGSRDNTEIILSENKIKHIELIHNLGIGGAVQTGYKYANENGYDIAVQFDGDGQHNVEYVHKIIQPLIEDKADLVIGSRFIDKMDGTFQSSFTRRIGIRLISITMKFVTGRKIFDTTSGFRACNREVIEEFSKNYPVEYPEPISTVYLLKKKYRISEIQVSMNERHEGTSSIKSWKNAYYMINVFLSIVVVGMRKDK